MRYLFILMITCGGLALRAQEVMQRCWWGLGWVEAGGPGIQYSLNAEAGTWLVQRRITVGLSTSLGYVSYDYRVLLAKHKYLIPRINLLVGSGRAYGLVGLNIPFGTETRGDIAGNFVTRDALYYLPTVGFRYQSLKHGLMLQTTIMPIFHSSRTQPLYYHYGINERLIESQDIPAYLWLGFGIGYGF